MSARNLLLYVAIAVTVLSIPVAGQESRATIAGRVTDASESVVVGANVVATNVNTGVSVSATTNESGSFVIPFLLPGTYRLAEQLIVNDINQLWVADITYVRLQAEFVYLAVVLDAFSRRAVGWALARNLQTPLPLAALELAIDNRRPSAGLVHHSDRGSQYASNDHVRRLESIGAVLSMSRPGQPWENGQCETFLKTLKLEEIDARPYHTMAELGAAPRGVH